MINGEWTSLHGADGGHQNLLMAFWNNNLHLSCETTMLDNRNLVWLGVSFTHYVWKISCYQLKPLLYYTYFISIGNLCFSVFFTFRYVSHLMEVEVWSGVVSLLVWWADRCGHTNISYQCYRITLTNDFKTKTRI